MNDGMNCMHDLALILFLRNSGKSPRTARRAAQSRQAAHVLLYGLGFLEEEPPSGTFPAARRRMTSYQNFGFLDELPGGNEQPPYEAS